VFRVRGWPGRARANADRRAPVLYVALGDSTVEGVGATTPRLVTLSIGPNDITAHVPVGDYERDVDTIFRRLTRETDAVVVANLLPDLAVTPRFRGRETTLEIGALTAPFNEALLRRARAYGIEVVDLYRPSQAEIPPASGARRQRRVPAIRRRVRAMGRDRLGRRGPAHRGSLN
jgi:lysophospholipase L1-like esterase